MTEKDAERKWIPYDQFAKLSAVQAFGRRRWNFGYWESRGGLDSRAQSNLMVHIKTTNAQGRFAEALHKLKPAPAQALALRYLRAAERLDLCKININPEQATAALRRLRTAPAQKKRTAYRKRMREDDAENPKTQWARVV